MGEIAMKRFENATFRSIRDRDSASHFHDLEFRGCHFESCGVSIASDPTLRSIVRNVEIHDCSQLGCSVRSAVIEETLVDGFNTRGQLLLVWAAVFSHVTLQGKIGRIMISELPSSSGEGAIDDVFARANAEYYCNVDWALDISRGEFAEIDIRGVPGHLIRRDPETQVLITREQALAGEWQGLRYHHGAYQIALQLFLKRTEPSFVLVAEKRSPRFREKLRDLQLLRSAGVAELD